MNQIQKKRNSIESFILFSLILVILTVGPNFNDPFNSAKLISLTFGTFGLAGYIVSNLSALKRKIFLVDKLLVLLVVGFFIAAIFSDNKLVALFGETQRKLGLITYVGLLLFFYGTVHFYRDFEQNNLRKLVLFFGILFVGYGYLQYSRNDIFRWNNPYNPIILTFGNPNFASSFLGILSILMFGFLLKPKKQLSIAIFLPILVFTVIIIIFSQSRQGIIVFLVGVLVMLTFYFRAKFPKIGKIIIYFSILLSIFAFLGLAKIGPLSNYLYKGSIGVRYFYWRAALRMFFDNPILGVGLDRYGTYFRIFRDQEYVKQFGYDISSSNAHNVFLQLLATGGILVGIPYIVLTGYIFLKSSKFLLRQKTYNPEVTLVFAAWLGFQSQAFISIDNLGLTLFGWFLAGVLIQNVIRTEHNSDYFSRIDISVKQKAPTSTVLVGLLCLISIFLSSFLFRNEKLALSSRASFQGENSNTSVVKELGNELISSRFMDASYKYQVAGNYVSLNLITEAISILEELIKTDKRNYEAYTMLAWCYEQQQSFFKAAQIRETILNLDPYGVPNMLSLGLNYKVLGKFQEMENIKVKIMQLDPNSNFAKDAEQLSK